MDKKKIIKLAVAGLVAGLSLIPQPGKASEDCGCSKTRTFAAGCGAGNRAGSGRQGCGAQKTADAYQEQPQRRSGCGAQKSADNYQQQPQRSGHGCGSNTKTGDN